MFYFNVLPIIQQPFGNSSLVSTNLVARNYFIPSLLSNFTYFYEYTIREIDSPDNIAYQYYNDPYRYWILLYSNEIFDVFFEWPLKYISFYNYVIDKYSELATLAGDDTYHYIRTTTHHYEKIISTWDSSNLTKQSVTIIIDETEYNSLLPSKTSKLFNNGVTVHYEVNKREVSIIEYEENINNDKSQINVLRDIYSSDVENQFRKLMRSY